MAPKTCRPHPGIKNFAAKDKFVPILYERSDFTKSSIRRSLTSESNEGGLPTDIPDRICLLVLVENAKEGGLNAVPVAEGVFEWYYNNRINSPEAKTEEN